MCSAFVEKLDGHAANGPQLALGNTAKSCRPPLGAPNPNPESARSARKIVRARLMKAVANKRRDNAALAAGARALLSVYESHADEFADFERVDGEQTSFRRVLGCGSLLGSVTPAFLTSETHKIVHGGLAQCGSVWVCPECAAKIQARRADENLTAIKWATARGYHVSLITLTATHNASERLVDLIDRFTSAYRRYGRSSTMARVRKDVGFVGSIKAVETTYGVNGWHWHAHVIYITEFPLGGYADDLRGAWLRALSSEGIFSFDDERAASAALAHAFRFDAIEMADDAVQAKGVAEYLAKMASSWEALAGADEVDKLEGLANETARLNTKLGRARNRTPFQILRDAIMIDPDDEKQDAAYSADLRLFVEYALATKGRQQIVWSHGLKAMVGIASLSDEELAEEQEESGTIVYGLTRAHWSALRRDGWMTEYLRDVAPTCSREVVQAYFDTMFPADNLPRVLDAEETRVIWERERQARAAAYARYRNGGDFPLTPEEKTAVFVDAHPWSTDGERERVAARQRAVAAQLQNERRAAGYEYQHQTSFDF